MTFQGCSKLGHEAQAFIPLKISHWMQVAPGRGCDLGQGRLRVIHKGTSQLKALARGRSPFLEEDLSPELCVTATTMLLSFLFSFLK